MPKVKTDSSVAGRRDGKAREESQSTSATTCAAEKDSLGTRHVKLYLTKRNEPSIPVLEYMRWFGGSKRPIPKFPVRSAMPGKVKNNGEYLITGSIDTGSLLTQAITSPLGPQTRSRTANRLPAAPRTEAQAGKHLTFRNVKPRRKNRLDLRQCDFDTLTCVMSWLHLSDLASLGRTNAFFSDVVHEYVSSFIRKLLAPMNMEYTLLFSLLHQSQSVISGSFALRCLFPGDNILPVPFIPNDMDIYVPRQREMTVVSFLTSEFGYAIKTEREQEYNIVGVRKVVTLQGKTGSLVDVIVSDTTCALDPIFASHSTSLMNFISSTGIFSGYYDLTKTFRYVSNSWIDTLTQRSAEVVAECMNKYKDRGFKEFDLRRHFCGFAYICPQTIRHLRDSASFFFTFGRRPWLQYHRRVPAIFSGGGEVVWRLGGRKCGGGEQTPIMARQAMPLMVLHLKPNHIPGKGVDLRKQANGA